jgi:YHS domain-containing protein
VVKSFNEPEPGAGLISYLVNSMQIAGIYREEGKTMKPDIDPVCGMQVNEENAAAMLEYLGRKYFFCSEDCQRKFEQRPEDYVVRRGQANINDFDA